MTLTELKKKINPGVSNIGDISTGTFLIVILCVMTVGMYFLSEILLHERTRSAELRVFSGETTAKAGETTPSLPGAYVASRSGTAYHLPWCVGALRIREENKIWFSSKEEAEQKGYHPAKNCKGL